MNALWHWCLVGFGAPVTLGALTRLCDFILGKFTVTSRVPGY